MKTAQRVNGAQPPSRQFARGTKIANLASEPLEFSHRRVPYRTKDGNRSQEWLKGTQVLQFLAVQEWELLCSRTKEARKSETTETEYLSLQVKKSMVHN